LSGAVWDADAVRNDVRGYVIEHLGDPAAVAVVDETGDCKKGTHTGGVQRHYTGTAGKIDNAQVAVYLTYASRHGHAIIDQELYLPRRWTADPARRAVAGVPEQVGFATKPELARRMLGRALAAEVPLAWVTGDEVYGGNPTLRDWLEIRALPYVLAVRCTESLQPPAEPPTTAKLLAAGVPPERWHISAGDGAKGKRWYAWTRVALADPGAPDGWGRWLLVRRSLTSGELALYRCAASAATPLAALVKVGPGSGRGWKSPFRPARGCVAGRAPGAPLALLVPLGDPGHAGVRLLGGRGPHRTHAASPTARRDRADVQRDRPSVRGPCAATSR
jgi:DDE superfamily endonuclease